MRMRDEAQRLAHDLLLQTAHTHARGVLSHCVDIRAHLNVSAPLVVLEQIIFVREDE